MNALPKFTFAPAVRERVGLLIGLAGASGSGKTMSALRIARGLAGGDDSRIAFIDTEGARGLHYAPQRGQKANGDKFAFQHGDLHAPFTPEAYMAAIAAADEAGFEVIVIDSVSHSWEGEGGLQDMHTELVEKAVEKARSDAAEKGWSFNESAVADRASIGAWKEPKMRHKRFISRLLQCRAHLVLCFRADEKMRMETVEEEGRNGKTYKKTIITQPKDLPPGERWVPICERRMPYELTVSLILTPAQPGIPIPIKLQAQHRAAVRDGEYLSEETGRALAEWARGGTAPTQSPATRDQAVEVRATLITMGSEQSVRGMNALRAFWTGLSKSDKAAVGGAAQLAAWKTIAEAADAPDVDFDDDGSAEDNHSPAPSEAPEPAGGVPPGPAEATPQGPLEGAASASSPRADAAPSSGPHDGEERYITGHHTHVPSDGAKQARRAEIRKDGDARAAAGTAALRNFLDELRENGESDLVSSTQKTAWRDTAKAADAKGRKSQ